MTYDPLTYWNERAEKNGPLYVAKGNAQEHYDREYREFEPALKELVPVSAGVLVDFGCGSGRFTPLLTTMCGLYVGADIAPEGIAQAKQNHPERVFLEPLTDRIPLRDGSVDVIVCVFVLQHMVSDFSEWCYEFRRVLRKGGSLVAIDRDPWPEGSPLAHMLPRGHEAVESATHTTLTMLRRVNEDHWGARYVK